MSLVDLLCALGFWVWTGRGTFVCPPKKQVRGGARLDVADEDSATPMDLVQDEAVKARLTAAASQTTA